MSFSDFFSNLFGSREQIEFYAMIFAALIVSIEREPSDTPDRIKAAAETLFDARKDRELFAALTRRYITDCAQNETSLNRLVRKIARVSKLYPSRITHMKDEAIEIAKADNDGVQDRVLEFIAILKAEASKT
ncbi:MAG: hypothetical protein LBO72_03850 [Helicobacteraceae bacterium]|jgi:hypothetical protein|nr:hypothetical protein [Helicobacteraceae bacterium]